MNPDELLKEVQRLRLEVEESHRTKAELGELQKRYEAIVEAFEGLIYICSADYKVEFMNRAFIERTGRNPVGEDCFRALHDLNEICPWCVNERVFRGETVRWEVQSPKDQRWYYIVNTPIYRPDGTVSKMAMIQDIHERKISEIALAESEDLLRRSQAIAHVGSWQLDLTSNRLVWSDEVYRIFGVQPQEFLATYEGFLETVHPDDRAAVDAAYSGSLREGRDTYEIEHRIVRKGSGEVRHVYEKCEHVRDSTGRIIRSVGIVQDITERKKAEEALQESEARFRTAFQTFPDPATITRISDGVFIEANNGFTELSGFTREEVIGRSVMELGIWHHPGDRDRLIAVLNARGHVTNLEAQFRGKNGRVRSGLMSARIIILAGEPHILTVTRDVEDWKRAEAALLESEKRYKDLFDNSTDLIYTHDLEGNFTSVNAAVSKVLGYDPEECLRLNVRDIIHPDYLRPIQNTFQEELQKILQITGSYQVAPPLLFLLD